MKMNAVKMKYIIILSLTIIFLNSCDGDKDYEKEMYKKVICLLSENDNTYTEEYKLGENESERYFSIICGGSLLNNKEITVTLESDTVLLSQYNKSNFDIDSASFAKELPKDRYEISTYTITIPTNSRDQYEKIPVKVRPEGLSPDSIYFIPIAIKSVSEGEINPDKYNLLYRVTIANDYAEQKTPTYYTKKMTQIGMTSGSQVILSRQHLVQPLTKNQVRIFAGDGLHKITTTTEDIGKYSMIVEVNADNSLTIKPYGTIEVEQLSMPDYNKYSRDKNGSKFERTFYMYYKYRILTPETESDSAYWSEWFEVQESLRFVEY